MPEGRAHRRPQCLRIHRVRAAAEQQARRRPERERRADQRADVAGILHAVDDEQRSARNIAQRPGPRLHDRQNALRRLGTREVAERACADFLDRNRMARQLGGQRLAARRPGQIRGHQGALELEARRQRFLDEPHAFHDGEAAAASRLTALKIAHGRLQITADVPSRAGHVCPKDDLGPFMRIALTIAGSDSGGAAGIQADLKTFHQFGVFGTSAITAVTAQNTLGVSAWQALPAALVAKQIDALAEDLRPTAIKSGMLGSREIVETVAERIGHHRLTTYVLDPVMVATSGDMLMEDPVGAQHVVPLQIARRLVPLAMLVTPNLNEAEILVGTDVRTPDQMEQAGRALVGMGARAALVKGGHLANAPTLVDVLVLEGSVRRFTHERIDTTSTHGTGCTLSAAITAGLALGRPLEEAVADGLDFVHRAIAAAPGLGRGHGPLNHFVPV